MLKSPIQILLQQTLPKENSNSPSAKFAVWNAQSIRGRRRASAIIDLVISEHLDILAITESWLTGDERDNRILSDLRNALPDYVTHHVPRPKRGGGVAVLMRRGFDIVFNPSFWSNLSNKWTLLFRRNFHP